MIKADAQQRQAAVLVPVFVHPSRGSCVVLVQRSDAGVHGGQLAFPGGKSDPSDRSLLDTALREAREEIGLDPAAVDVLAALPVLDTRTTGFRIAPFLGRITRPETWEVEEAEIAKVLEISLADLLDPAAHTTEVMDFPTWPEPRRAPLYQVGEHRIWGVTYRILDPLLPRLAAGEWAM